MTYETYGFETGQMLGVGFAPRFRAFGIEPVPVSPLRASID